MFDDTTTLIEKTYWMAHNISSFIFWVLSYRPTRHEKECNNVKENIAWRADEESFHFNKSQFPHFIFFLLP